MIGPQTGFCAKVKKKHQFKKEKWLQKKLAKRIDYSFPLLVLSNTKKEVSKSTAKDPENSVIDQVLLSLGGEGEFLYT